MIDDNVLLALALKNKGGGGGGATNYNDLNNKPQVNGNELIGNQTGTQLGLYEVSNETLVFN